MTNRHHRLATHVAPVTFAASLLTPALAETHDEIVESCGQSVGRPIVQACMGGQRGDSGKDFTNDKGQPVFSYAHPLFWAPYSIIGDGG